VFSKKSETDGLFLWYFQRRQFASINFDLFPRKITIRWLTGLAVKFSTQNKFPRHAAARFTRRLLISNIFIHLRCERARQSDKHFTNLNAALQEVEAEQTGHEAALAACRAID